MDCSDCALKNFLHADIYCQGCLDKPEPKQEMIKGIAYLYKNGSSTVTASVEVELPKGREYEFAVEKLMEKFKIEFVAE